MKKNNLWLLSLCLASSLVISGCSLFSSKDEDENHIDTEWEENIESVSDTEMEDATENLFGTEAAETTETTETTESTEVTETTEATEVENVTKAEAANPEKGNTTANDTEKKPSNTQKPSSSQTPSSEKEPEIYVVDMETGQERLAPEAYKYGVTRTKILDRTYEVYNDGSKVCVAEYESYTYDSSTYNATDDQIRGESDSNCASYMGYYQEVLNLVNQIRAEAGVAPLTLDVTLCNAASMRALEMDYANYFEHARADGRDCFSAMNYYGCVYSSAGENIAAGYSSPASVVEGWRNSPGHYANMINANFTKLGVGYCNAGIGEYNGYWVQLFSN